MNGKRFARSKSLFAIALFLCAGCGMFGNETNLSTSLDVRESARPAGVGEDSVTVFTARHYAADTVLFEAFEKKTGIRVNEVKGTAEELVEAMKREGEKSEADLFFTVDGGVLSDAKREGVLQPMRSDAIDRNVPPGRRDSDHYWVGVTTRARVIVYAKDRVKRDELSTYENLTEAKWKGRILVRSYSSLYNQSLLASFISLNGKEEAESWAGGIVRNFARQPEGGDREQAIAIVQGIGDVAIMNTYYLGQLSISEDADEARVPDGLGVFYPNQETTGTHINISGIGLAKYAKHEENALKLVEYMTSEEGQSLLSHESFEFPVNERAEIPELLKSWGPFKAQDINFEDLEKYRQEAIGIFKNTGWL